VLVCVLCFLRERFYFRFIKTKKSKPPFVALRQVFGYGGADVLTECNASVIVCCCERTKLILINVMIQLLNIFLITLMKINHYVYIV